MGPVSLSRIHMVQVSNRISSRPSSSLTTYNYNSDGDIASINRPEGFTSTYQYLNRVLVQEDVPAGTVLSIIYDTNLWLPLNSYDALGNRTTYQYDVNGNLTTLV